jgi:hypothetical protein
LDSARAPCVVVAVAVALGACGGVNPISASADEPRRPDGVAVDPAMATPSARAEAQAAAGLVALRSPIGTDRALATVEELFRHVVAKDADGLTQVFTRDAVTVVPGGGGPGPTSNAIAWWQMRFARLDYTKLAGAPIFRAADADVARGEASLRAVNVGSMRTERIADDDVVVHAPLLTTHAGADRFFGDEMTFWLRRDGDRYKIYRVLEDFQLN